jgi:hypothetical protein
MRQIERRIIQRCDWLREKDENDGGGVEWEVRSVTSLAGRKGDEDKKLGNPIG